jgi:hypothetical protein
MEALLDVVRVYAGFMASCFGLAKRRLEEEKGLSVFVFHYNAKTKRLYDTADVPHQLRVMESRLTQAGQSPCKTVILSYTKRGMFCIDLSPTEVAAPMVRQGKGSWEKRAPLTFAALNP